MIIIITVDFITCIIIVVTIIVTNIIDILIFGYCYYWC